jgi:hypothetical protein
MTTRRRYKPYAWVPLTMLPGEVAEVVFRRSEAWFLAHTPPDFPAPVDGLYATEAVHDWVRARHGLATAPEGTQAADAVIMERLRGGKDARALSGHKAA